MRRSRVSDTRKGRVGVRREREETNRSTLVPSSLPTFVPRVSCYTVNLFQFPSHWDPRVRRRDEMWTGKGWSLPSRSHLFPMPFTSSPFPSRPEGTGPRDERSEWPAPKGTRWGKGTTWEFRLFRVTPFHPRFGRLSLRSPFTRHSTSTHLRFVPEQNVKGKNRTERWSEKGKVRTDDVSDKGTEDVGSVPFIFSRLTLGSFPVFHPLHLASRHSTPLVPRSVPCRRRMEWWGTRREPSPTDAERNGTRCGVTRDEPGRM